MTSIYNILICNFACLLLINAFVFKLETMIYYFLGLCNFLAVLLFGIYADAIPGKWMPRADYTFLSWSYHLVVGSIISSFFAGNLFFPSYLYKRLFLIVLFI